MKCVTCGFPILGKTEPSKTRASGSCALGDMKFTGHELGHAGASSSFPCQLCLVKQDHLKGMAPEAFVEESKQTMRTLKHVRECANLYGEIMKTNDAKLTRNALKHTYSINVQPLFDRELAIPGLHILLGLVTRWISEIEAECTSIDMANAGPGDLTNLSEVKEAYKSKCSDIISTKEAIDYVKAMVETQESAIKALTAAGKNGSSNDIDEKDQCSALVCLAGYSDSLEENVNWGKCQLCKKWYHFHCCLINDLAKQEDLLNDKRTPWSLSLLSREASHNTRNRTRSISSSTTGI